MYGTVGPYAPSNPMVTGTSTITESGSINSGNSALCLVGGGHQEIFSTVPPPGTAPFYPSTSSMPCRHWTTVAVEPGGNTVYYYAISNSLFQTECFPDKVVASSYIQYNWLQTGNPATAITSAGYTLDPVFSSGQWDDRYVASGTDTTYQILVRFLLGSFYECLISVSYNKTITNTADMITVVPNPLVLTPLWNPGSMYAETTFA